MTATPATLDLAPALVVLPGPRAAVADATGAQPLRTPDARDLFEQWPVLVAQAAMTARRLGVPVPPRSGRVFDALELYAFVRPGRFCAPSAAGLAQALGMAEPKGAEAQAEALQTRYGDRKSHPSNPEGWPADIRRAADRGRGGRAGAYGVGAGRSARTTARSSMTVSSSASASSG